MRITKKEDFLPESFDYSEEDARFMEMAIALSEQNVDEGGGPFGAPRFARPFTVGHANAYPLLLFQHGQVT
jgi:hypothetical protein